MLLAVIARDWATPFGSRKLHLNTLDRTCHPQKICAPSRNNVPRMLLHVLQVVAPRYDFLFLGLVF